MKVAPDLLHNGGTSFASLRPEAKDVLIVEDAPDKVRLPSVGE
jgi:hypothetical protein